MKVFVGCEYSGIVRDAFLSQGHDAVSCDLLPTESLGAHIQGDVIQFLNSVPDGYFDIGIFHPPCTAMSLSGNRTYAKGCEKSLERLKVVEWTIGLWNLSIKKCKKVCLENPASVIFPYLRKLGALVQYVQPYQHGHAETKKTGFALYGLPCLIETKNVYEYMMTLPKKERNRIWYLSPGKNRSKERSKFYSGIAAAMADQWTRQYSFLFELKELERQIQSNNAITPH